MVNEKIIRALRAMNPFWSKPLEVDYRERKIYEKIQKFVKTHQIISLCGLRRVGKTTILKKIMGDLMKENSSDSILYFSFDDFQASELFDVIDAFVSIHEKEPRFLIFDEIQKLPNWAEKIKILYDTGKYKIFVSGSESLSLKKGARESLAGRIYEFEVKALDFSEYLTFVNKFEMTKKPLLYELDLKIELNRYLVTAGFPEMIGVEDRAEVRKYIKSAIIESIVFSDMIRIYPIDEPKQLISILEILIDNPGMTVDLSSLSQELGIHRHTLSKYFEYLELAHLVVKLYNFSRNRITSEKSLKKFYPTFLSPVLTEESEETMGKLIETVCVMATDAKFFWRDKYKDEVDIILQDNTELIPIEVKYRNKPSQNKGLPKFNKKFKSNTAFLITKDARKKAEETNGIEWIPVYEFLLRFSI